MNQDTPSGTPRPRPTPTRVQPMANNKNKARTRLGRIDPLLRAMKEIEDIKNPMLAARLWLEVAEFYYGKPKDGVRTAVDGVQSKANAKNAFRLLKQLEMKARGTVPKEAPFNAPKTEPKRPLPSDSVRLGDGDTSLQITPPPSEGL